MTLQNPTVLAKKSIDIKSERQLNDVEWQYIASIKHMTYTAF